MVEIRCKQCNKLLGYIDGKYAIKCPRCGEMNVIKENVKMNILINFEQRRVNWHKAIDAEMDEAIRKAKIQCEAAGIKLCTSEAEFMNTKESVNDEKANCNVG